MVASDCTGPATGGHEKGNVKGARQLALRHPVLGGGLHAAHSTLEGQQQRTPSQDPHLQQVAP